MDILTLPQFCVRMVDRYPYGYHHERGVGYEESQHKKHRIYKETVVRFQGDHYHYDLTISSSDKSAISQVLIAYEKLEEN